MACCRVNAKIGIAQRSGVVPIDRYPPVLMGESNLNRNEMKELRHYDTITPETRLAAACRRFQFEVIKSLGIFLLIEKTPWLNIKEPWNKLYQRAKRQQLQAKFKPTS